MVEKPYVRSHPMRPKLHTQHLAERIDGRLCGADMRLVGQAGVVQCRAHKEDLSARALQLWERGFDGVVGAEHVNVHHGLEGVGRQVRGGCEEVAGGSTAVSPPPPHIPPLAILPM